LTEQGRLLAEPANISEPYRFTHDAHNDWLQLAAESGGGALLLFAGLIALGMRESWRKKRWWLVALLVSFSVNALLHFPLDIIPSASLFWMALGWSLSQRTEIEKSKKRSNLLPVRLLGAGLCIAALLLFNRQLYASALLNRGMSLSLGGDMPEADAPLEACVGIDPADTRAWLRLGLNADARGNAVASAEAFEHCQDSPEGLANLGLAQAKEGQLDEGKQTSLRSMDLNPRSVETIGNLGKIEYLQWDPLGAEAIYKSGLKLQPDWAEGHFNLAAIYINTGRKADARNELQEFLRLEPGNEQGIRLLKGLR
jgi:tetratricopeptide (TPR) repeat protein